MIDTSSSSFSSPYLSPRHNTLFKITATPFNSAFLSIYYSLSIPSARLVFISLLRRLLVLLSQIAPRSAFQLSELKMASGRRASSSPSEAHYVENSWRGENDINSFFYCELWIMPCRGIVHGMRKDKVVSCS